ncbi:hypothetical protein [Bifidobacterium choloepi]|uniref:hypothetical protein n=1 Tax=Bifidobacterium choloepi TaxID=2614131 RepID=UPI0013D8CFA4|nr:hypothetical protein [Bifidobacterium choloepi]
MVAPSLLCGLAVAASDIRRRLVPRRWIAAGVACQLIVLLVVALADTPAGTTETTAIGVAEGDASGVTGTILATVLVPACWGVAAGLLQWMLALARPGALGFGDVTASAMCGVAVGVFGAVVFARWWLLMGLLGLACLATWHRVARSPGMPFVPVIVLSAVLSVVLSR